MTGPAPQELQASSATTVYLNVYDLIEQNHWTYWCGVGIFHSGVEVYGVEYAFGGHEYDAPGVFATSPKQAPGTVTFRESVPIGETSLSPQEVHAVVQQMGRTYRGNQYHLLQMNCNTFSSDLCERLTGREAPAWVNRLAHMAVALQCLLPAGWLPPLRPPTARPASDDLQEAVMEGDEQRSLLADDLRSERRPYQSAPQLVATS
ncbi:hypothetical protein N2152v2_008023 [Parachlorella kessleri]